MTTRGVIAVWALVASLGALGCPASGAEKSAEQMAFEYYQAGLELFRSGRFEQAAEKFQLAYNLDSSAPLLRNLGRAHEEAGNREKALLHFKNYLLKYPGAEDRGELEARIAKLEASMAGDEGESTVSPPHALRIFGWLGLGANHDVDFGEGKVLGFPRVPPAPADLGKIAFENSFLGAASLEADLWGAVWLGGRLAVGATETEDGDGGLQTYDLGAVVRYEAPLSERIAFLGSGWAGLTAARGTIINKGTRQQLEVDIEGLGFHLGGAAGVLAGISERLRLHSALSFTYHQFSLETEKFGDAGNRGLYKWDRVQASRLYLELGLVYDI